MVCAGVSVHEKNGRPDLTIGTSTRRETGVGVRGHSDSQVRRESPNRHLNVLGDFYEYWY